MQPSFCQIATRAGEAPATGGFDHNLDRMLGNELDFAYRRRVAAVFEHLDLEDGHRILDCGCGRGFYLNFCRGLTARSEIVGVDSDLAVLAETRLPEGRTRVFTLRSCATDLPFRDGVFDRIIVSEVLEHIHDHENALSELWRVLAPQGVAVVTVPNARFPALYDPINAFLGVFGWRIRRGPLAGIWTDHVRLYRLDELVGLAERARFEVEDHALICHSCTPFQHNLLYGIGKPLLLSGCLPDSLARAGDRSRYDENQGTWLNPVNLARRVMAWVDSVNDRTRSHGRSVNLLLKLRKPAGAQGG